MSDLGPTRSQSLIYTPQPGNIRVRFDDETVWLAQKQTYDPFDWPQGNISEHVKSVIDEGEPAPPRTVRESRTVRGEGTHKDSLALRREGRHHRRRVFTVYATAIDDDPALSPTPTFYATGENELHWPTIGQNVEGVFRRYTEMSSPKLGTTTCRARLTTDQDGQRLPGSQA